MMTYFARYTVDNKTVAIGIDSNRARACDAADTELLRMVKDISTARFVVDAFEVTVPVDYDGE